MSAAFVYLVRSAVGCSAVGSVGFTLGFGLLFGIWLALRGGVYGLVCVLLVC